MATEINIDMDRPCSNCGKPGATDSGLCLACTTADLRRQVRDRIDQEAANASPVADEPKITSKLIQECLFANEMGDGTLFAALFRDKFLYCKNTQEWFEWTGHRWKMDMMNRSLTSVEQVAAEYLSEYGKVAAQISDKVKAGEDSSSKSIEKLKDQQHQLLKRVSQLRGDKRRTACLKFAHTIADPLAITGDEFDNKPMLFPCANGVIDLETGRLKEGRPGDYLSKASDVLFKGIGEPAPLWEKSLLEIFGGNSQKAPDAQENERAGRFTAYIRRLFGYSMTGLVIEKVFPVLYGPTGWNGRSLIVDTISRVMGELAGSIPSEMLLSVKFTKSAAGPSPDIMGLKGLRLALASEIDENQRFSAAKIKWLTGKDELVGRSPHDKYQTRFDPTHKLLLMSNTQPQAPPNDKAFWERLHLIPFTISFVNRDPQEVHERRAILNLGDQLLKEAPGILAWLVRGCLEYQREGLKPPKEITEATEEYRKNEDLLADFIDECCLREPGAKEKSAALYQRFVDWYKDNIGEKVPSGTWFGKLLSQKFKKWKSEGCVMYHGIALKGATRQGELDGRADKDD